MAAFDGDVRGSIGPASWPTSRSVDRNLMKIDPADILKMNVDLTIVDGKIVFERQHD
jgi:predicted amidohydrolase YtcJ